MAEEHAADTRFDRRLALTQDAFTDRHYPTASYTLVAAMCEAEATQEGVPGVSGRKLTVCP